MPVREYNRSQCRLLPIDLLDTLGEDHLAVIVCEVIDQLDLGILYDKVSDEGAPCYDPRMMISVLIYAYGTGVCSSRHIARKLREDMAYIYIAAQQQPDFRTISDFRKDNKGVFIEVFREVVRYCDRLGMVPLGHVAVDGTKIRANASEGATYDVKRVEREIAGIVRKAEEVDAAEDEEYGEDNDGSGIPEEIKGLAKLRKKFEEIEKETDGSKTEKVNATDADARFMKTRGGVKMGYNAQVAVDEENGVIVSADVVNAAADEGQLTPMVKKVMENVGRKPGIVSADAGYGIGRNYRYLREEGIEGYIPVKSRMKVKSRFSNEAFTYKEDEDVVICPEGKVLTFRGYDKKPNYDGPARRYRGDDCGLCKCRNECTTNKNGRSVNIGIYRKDIMDMRERLKTERGKGYYKRRATVVEPVFGDIKWNLGYVRFGLRGLEKVRGEFSLIAIAHNIKKIRTYLKTEDPTVSILCFIVHFVRSPKRLIFSYH